MAVRIPRPPTNPRAFEAQIRQGRGLRAGGPAPKVVEVDGHMTYCDPLIVGESLGYIIDRSPRRALPLVVAVNIVVGISEALGHPLQIHGDLLPRHVLIGYDGVVYLRDPVGEVLVRPDESRVDYMAPEQLEGRPTSFASDVFATGVLLFEMTTGARLFGHLSLDERRARLLGGEIPRPRDVAGDGYPLDLQLVVRKMLRPSDTARFDSVLSASHALQRLPSIAEETVLARTDAPASPSMPAKAAKAAMAADAQARAAMIAPADRGREALSTWMQRTFPDRIERWRAVLGPAAQLPSVDMVERETPRGRAGLSLGSASVEAESDARTQQTSLKELRARRAQAETTALWPLAPLGQSPVDDPDAEQPTKVGTRLEIEPADSLQQTSLDAIEETGMALQPLSTLVPPALISGSPFLVESATMRPEPMTDPGEVFETTQESTAPQLEIDRPIEPPLNWQTADLPAADTRSGPPLSDTVDDASSTALINRNELRAMHHALEIVSADSDPEPPPADLVAEPPPLVPPPPSKQAHISTQVVRERVVPNAPGPLVQDPWDVQAPTNVDPVETAEHRRPPDPLGEPADRLENRTSISDQEPSLVIPISEENESAPGLRQEGHGRRGHRVPWLLIGGLILAVGVALAAVRFGLQSSVPVPAPTLPDGASSPENSEPAP